jgi:hypothetical protein
MQGSTNYFVCCKNGGNKDYSSSKDLDAWNKYITFAA